MITLYFKANIKYNLEILINEVNYIVANIVISIYSVSKHVVDQFSQVNARNNANISTA